MSRTGRDDEKLADLDELIRKIVDDAQQRLAAQVQPKPKPAT